MSAALRKGSLTWRLLPTDSLYSCRLRFSRFASWRRHANENRPLTSKLGVVQVVRRLKGLSLWHSKILVTEGSRRDLRRRV